MAENEYDFSFSGLKSVVCWFLPDSIPVHFNAQGEADLVVNKWFLLLGTVIPYSAYIQLFRKRKGGK